MKIIQSILTNNDCYKSGRSITVKGLMLHSTGCSQSDANVFVRTWNQPNVEMAVHAFIDANGVHQTLPWTMRAWHAGGAANNTHIGVEICEPSGFTYRNGCEMVGYDVNKNASYFKIVYINAVELFAYLCKQYRLNPLTDIICHSEGYTKGIATGHADVMHWFPKHGKSMDTFRSDVKATMNSGSIKIDSVISSGSSTTSGIYLSRCKSFIESSGRCKELQEKLNKLNYNCGTVDGIFGPNTLNALLDFQRSNGLAVDGLAGTATFAKLNQIIEGSNVNVQVSAGWVSSLQQCIGVSVDNIAGPVTLGHCPVVKYGYNGAVTKLVQEKLNSLGFDCGKADGIFGNKTANAVINFQKSKGLSADGIIGQNTWKKLLGLS